MPTFDPQTDIPDLNGKVCLITGANSGLGEAVITALAQHNPERLYLATRSRVRAEEAISRIRATSAAAAAANIQFLDLDLASFASVKAAAARVNNEVDRLDILQLNAGVGILPFATTEDGYEVQFGINYMGHALLTQLLMPTLLKTAARPDTDVRVVSVTSISHKGMAPKEGILFDGLKTDMKQSSGTALYAHSKLANALFALELAKRYPQITCSSVHPGGIKSNAWSGQKNINWFLYNLVVLPLVAIGGISPQEGSKTPLWCSFSKDVKSGSYYEPVGKPGMEGKLTNNAEMATKLWNWTDKELLAHGTPGWKGAKQSVA